jgi:hypothetical protein
MEGQTMANINPFGGNGPTMLAVAWAETGIAMFVLAMRFYARSLTGNAFSWDMIWVSIAAVSIIQPRCVPDTGD